MFFGRWNICHVEKFASDFIDTHFIQILLKRRHLSLLRRLLAVVIKNKIGVPHNGLFVNLTSYFQIAADPKCNFRFLSHRLYLHYKNETVKILIHVMLNLGTCVVGLRVAGAIIVRKANRRRKFFVSVSFITVFCFGFGTWAEKIWYGVFLLLSRLPVDFVYTLKALINATLILAIGC